MTLVSTLLTIVLTLVGTRYAAQQVDRFKQQHPLLWAPVSVLSSALRLAVPTPSALRLPGAGPRIDPVTTAFPPSSRRPQAPQPTFLESLVMDAPLIPPHGPGSNSSPNALPTAHVPLVSEEAVDPTGSGGDTRASHAAAGDGGDAHQRVRAAMQSGHGGFVSNAVMAAALLVGRVKDYVTGDDLLIPRPSAQPTPAGPTPVGGFAEASFPGASGVDADSVRS